ncbi:hypothetical protein WN943_018440 [Citrus x changshan-huyou]
MAASKLSLKLLIVKLVKNKHLILHAIKPKQELSANPKSPICPTEIPLLLSDDKNVVPNARKFCPCSNVGYSRHFHAADAPNKSCPSCNMRMNSGITFVYPAAGASAAAAVAEPERGFVKEAVACIVMDN